MLSLLRLEVTRDQTAAGAREGTEFVVELTVPDLSTFEKVLTDQILAIGPVRDARSTFCIRIVMARGRLPLASRPASRA